MTDDGGAAVSGNPTKTLPAGPTEDLVQPVSINALTAIGLTAEQFAALDVDKMAKVLDFSLKVNAEQAKREYEAAFERVQKRIEPVRRAGYNPDRKSHYAKAEHLCQMLDPILIDEGFSWSVSDTDCPVPGHIRITLRLRHSGHTEQHHYDSPIWDGRGPKGGGVMNALEASGSMRTYAGRYIRIGTFGIQLIDDRDGASYSARKITAEQAEDIEDLIRETGSNRSRFLNVYGVDKVTDLPVNVHKAALRQLEAKRKP